MMKIKMKQLSIHLVFLLFNTLPYMYPSRSTHVIDSYDDASFRLQCQLIRYLSLGQLRVRLEKSMYRGLGHLHVVRETSH